MDKIQDNKLKKYKAILQHLQSDPKATAAIPAFAKAITGFNDLIEAIGTVAKQQTFLTTGVGQSKAELKAALAAVATNVANALNVHASDIADTELGAKTDYTPTELGYMRDQELESHAIEIWNRAEALDKEKKEYYGLSDGLMATFGVLLDSYKKGFQSPRAAIADRSYLTDTLEGLFTKADTVLTGRFDKLVGLLKKDWPDYYGHYQKARTTAEKAGAAQKPDTNKTEVPV